MKNFATILIVCVLFAGALQAEKVAVVSKVQGDVLLQKAADLEYNRTVTMGTILDNNDQIKVNDGFAVILLLDDKSQVKLRENTEVAIGLVEDLSGSGYHVRLDYGQALTKYAKGADFEFQLHTPTSVASIKGTEFWTITDPETGDQVIVIEGEVDVMNNFTGMMSTAGAGETVTSGTDGYIESGETQDGTIPEDPEETYGAVEEATEEEDTAVSDSTEVEDDEVLVEEDVEEEGAVVTGDIPAPPPSTIGETTPEPETEEEEEEGGGLFGDALAMDAAFGAVTLDGQLYNQIALRPDISIGKLGVGLDIVLYMNQDGDIRSDDWDEYTDVIDKIMYVRWGHPQDPLYIRVGTLENVVMGYGLFVNGYNNMMEYPQVRKIGTHVGFTLGNFGIEAMVANVKELVGLTSFRGTYSLGKLKLGTTVAADVNQYLGFKDSDDDGRPDIVDDFPDNDLYWLDTDGDGYADNDPTEYDLDGDNKTDNHPNSIYNFDDDGVILGRQPFNLDGESSTLAGVSFDIGYPIFSSGFLDLLVFAEAGQYLGDHNIYSYTTAGGLDSTVVTHGWGMTAPGVRATIMKFVNLSLEYRMTGENFAYSLFDQNYDIDRVSMQAFGVDIMKPYTRDARLLNTTKMQGIFGSLSVNVLSLVTVNGAYQHMMQVDADPVKGIYGSIDVAPDLVPKLAGASAYINRMNVDDPFDIYSEGTLFGYKVVFELGGGATLTWDFRQTFRDLDGNGEIDLSDGTEEVIKTTVIETGFSF
ncbi:MAG: FecR family protein [Candidatus Marinimicrobia bacterium]|nr:FecR family protein [Candidatus Neomarinimicrobiota bacterium]